MKSQDDPVTDDETVLRLVWKEFYKPGDPLVVKPRAFHPRADETTGISVFRNACLRAPADALLALSKPENRPLYLIVGLPVSELKILDISVKPDRIETVPGHALLEELNRTSWDADRAYWLPRVEKLAELAGRYVLHDPSTASGTG